MTPCGDVPARSPGRDPRDPWTACTSEAGHDGDHQGPLRMSNGSVYTVRWPAVVAARSASEETP